MSGWEIAGYVSWFAAVLVGIVFVVRELWIDGRRTHEVTNGRIGDVHQPVIEPTQAWQQSCGAGTTEFPAPPVAYPSLLARVLGALVQGWALLSAGLAGGDRPAAPAGRHKPAHARTPEAVARQLVDGSDVSDGQVAQAVDAGFVAAGLPGLRAVGVARVAERLSWEDIDRKRADQDAWLADPDRTGWMPLVPARRDGVR
ncbi:hypothetical protein [Micromonospora profundi]|uniref:hypothetical protein n=1 Tax=Micromonospora profundi TaxID=1420889 RepID=UPI00364FAD52